jgi:outer membrane protein OmpA-like peptidoglycan-associated protein
MHLKTKMMTATLAVVAAAFPAAASAQASASDLMAMSVSDLRGEIGQRYDASLAMTRQGSAISADDPRYLWALQAKAQCGIALGFLKSNTKDPVSIGKCVDAAARMNTQLTSAPAPAPAPAPNPACAETIAGIVFFEWDSAVLPESAMPTIQAAAQSVATCGWKSVSVAGHTDRSGSDNYNDALARRRAEAVAQQLFAQGASSNTVEVSSFGEREPKVPTADGERNPQNRRVEITVKN